MNVLAATVALVAAERLAELVHAARNTRALRRRGAIEIGRRHYPWLVTLHVTWLVTLAALARRDPPPVWPWLGLFAGLQMVRLWVLASLGPYWTTRVMTLPGAPLVRRGPYRWLRHPNYLVVASEIAVLPLAFGFWRVALLFSVPNLALLAWRIRVEEQALAPRRYPPPIPSP
jgi:methyltransferase